MLGFNRTEIHPERFPAIEKRIRIAQEEALERIGGEFQWWLQHLRLVGVVDEFEYSLGGFLPA